MPDKNIEAKKAITYESEFVDSLNSLLKQYKNLREVKYFLDTTYDYFSSNNMAKRRPEIIVLGTSIPEELIYAIGAKPFWILGGSLGTAAWADDLVPRDTDPVSRSVLGYLMNDKNDISQNAVIVVPITCDSTRKIAYLLRKANRKVITVDFPPEKNDPFAYVKWEEQMYRLVEQLSAYASKGISKYSLMDAVDKVSTARKLMRHFITITQNNNTLLSGAVRMLVLNSYYYCDNIKQWSIHLDKLNKELLEVAKRTRVYKPDQPNVLIMGSPIYFPNYKIPFLIQDIGLTIRSSVDVTTPKIFDQLSLKEIGRNKKAIFSAIVKAHYERDCSGAYAQNNTLYRNILQQIQDGSIEGVVYHVLKGQIEYDFELERFEQLFSSYEIPVFRLETDYQYQDVEQIRIRMEAFMEMLVQNRYREVKKACQ